MHVYASEYLTRKFLFQKRPLTSRSHRSTLLIAKSKTYEATVTAEKTLDT